MEQSGSGDSSTASLGAGPSSSRPGKDKNALSGQMVEGSGREFQKSGGGGVRETTQGSWLKSREEKKNEGTSRSSFQVGNLLGLVERGQGRSGPGNKRFDCVVTERVANAGSSWALRSVYCYRERASLAWGSPKDV